MMDFTYFSQIYVGSKFEELTIVFDTGSTMTVLDLANADGGDSPIGYDP